VLVSDDLRLAVLCASDAKGSQAARVADATGILLLLVWRVAIWVLIG